MGEEYGTIITSDGTGSMNIMAAGCWFDSGSFSDPSNLPGLHHFLEHILLNIPNIKKQFHKLKEKGILVNAFTSHEIICFYAASPEEDMEEIMEFMKELLSSKINPNEDLGFENERNIILSELEYHNILVEHARESILNRMFPELRDRFRILGTNEGIKSIRLEDVSELYNNIANRSCRFLTLCGNGIDQWLMDKQERYQGFNKNTCHSGQEDKSIHTNLQYHPVQSAGEALHYSKDKIVHYTAGMFFRKEFRKEGQVFSEYVKEQLTEELRERLSMTYRVETSNLNFRSGYVTFWMIKTLGQNVPLITEKIHLLIEKMKEEQADLLNQLERKIRIRNSIKNNNVLSSLLNLGYENTILKDETDDCDFIAFIKTMQNRKGDFYQNVIEL